MKHLFLHTALGLKYHLEQPRFTRVEAAEPPCSLFKRSHGGDERLDRCGSTEAVKGNPETQTLTGNALDQYGSVRSTALTTLRVGWPATMWPSFAIGESLTAGGACIRQYDKHQQSPALQIRPISL